MSGMFGGATNFNQNLSGWDVSNVTSMNSMFYNATSFNQDIGSWDVSKVTSMGSMFYRATSFNQDLSSWDVSNVTDMSNMLNGVTLSTDNYDSLLLSWSNQAVQPNIKFHAGNSKYSSASVDARQVLVDKGWTITDGGEAPSTFVSTWNIPSNDKTLTLPITAQGNVEVDWGDGSEPSNSLSHEYEEEGTYKVKVYGKGEFGFGPYNTAHASKLVSIEDWGDIKVKNDGYQFCWCSNLVDVGDIDISNVTNMSGMFHSTTIFNQDLSSWDVSNVTDMGFMFYGATSFNQDISGWDVSNVTIMQSMFNGATSFNRDINGWNVSNVTNMGRMFYRATSFNQDLSNWDTSKVTNMNNMFNGATSFDSDISGWNVSNVTDMYQMFSGATNFNQPLNSWDVSNVTIMYQMFYNASNFNQDLSGWDVSNVTNMLQMFHNATNFNQDLSSWDVSNVTDMSNMFNGVTLSTDNYDSLLLSWAEQDVKLNVSFDGGNSKYSSAAVNARQVLVDKGWTINDGGQGVVPTFVSNWSIPSGDKTLALPISDQTQDFTVDWGDGSEPDTSLSHEYEEEGVYEVRVTGDGLFGFSASNTHSSKLVSIEDWGDIKVHNNGSQFFGCSKLVDVGDIDISHVTKMSHMFDSASNFNQDLSSWDVSNVTDMDWMFSGATNFNQPLNSWNVSNVTNMSYMFFRATSFNSDISDWNVSNVTDMSRMFHNASNFNQNLSGWDVSNVTIMIYMFYNATSFNQDISGWNVSNITSMDSMFSGATSFNSDISGWDVSNVTNMSNMLNGVTLSTDNYDSLLISWSQQDLKPNVTFNAGNSKYSSVAVNARQILVDKGWTITDGGLQE